MISFPLWALLGCSLSQQLMWDLISGYSWYDVPIGLTVRQPTGKFVVQSPLAHLERIEPFIGPGDTFGYAGTT